MENFVVHYTKSKDAFPKLSRDVILEVGMRITSLTPGLKLYGLIVIIFPFPPSAPNFNVAWDAFKASGPIENNHGDIAFLIKVTFSNNRPLLGVAFLEAKRMYENGNYSTLKWPQLSFQASHSSNHRIVLYDYKRSHGNHSLYGSACHHHCCKYSDEYYFEGTRAHVVPTHHAITLNTKTRDLHSIGFPLSYQILCRYFYGLDLDFSSDLVQAVQNGAAGGVNFLMVAHAIIGGEGEPSIRGILSDNNQEYQPLG